MINVPLTVVASRAVGFAISGRMPMTASTMMMTRPALRCLQDTVLCYTPCYDYATVYGLGNYIDNSGWTLLLHAYLAHRIIHMLQASHASRVFCAVQVQLGLHALWATDSLQAEFCYSIFGMQRTYSCRLIHLPCFCNLIFDGNNQSDIFKTHDQFCQHSLMIGL